MQPWNLVATCAFGLEALTARELQNLGYETKSENGLVRFTGDDHAIARSNLWLRTAERVFIELASFEATTFEDLFQGVLAIPWEDILPKNAEFPVVGKSVKSILHSVPACQSITKKAVVERLKRTYQQESFEESGALYRIEVAINKDVATIRLDTSGNGLHRRGYRKLNATAPLRETLAAALVLLSRWDAHRPFWDPMCGSGTIAIEAALYGLRRAPGALRSFASEAWPTLADEAFPEARDEAADLARHVDLNIVASDVDTEVLELTNRHLQLADLDGLIEVRKADARRTQPDDEYGCIISNPPYGERLMTVDETERLYRAIGKNFRTLDSWSVFILTSNPSFERLYGAKADKRRKLYNGRIETQLFQYLGPLPPRPPKA
ncbi:THUMP domain-containing class I SAM-dependent RNA methyltransferase [Alicyclobacillus fastidiosus]|uniref:Class I SAM-dependent RNA methyltransferase n=1 Tax=Alicyclobacillus fastidiosus TaxID=392011 RepID=A0ABV5ADB8_9BACL|nr:class I SAM-dependent RNA methyltransferase [Alicyclobacillus fastidiosus]WEH08704.1 class I SAM-dependent RNA methyltransferase [Alicyclobacillus fastidiosus]